MLHILLGSKLRANVLAWLLCHPDERYFVRQLESILGEDSTNLSRELAQLAELGILVSQTEGRQKYYQADKHCPIFPELQGLAIKTVGVADVLRAALADLTGRIQVAFVYGSFAQGQPRAGSDVDLMVVGDVTFAEVVAALREAQQKLGREVNPTVYPPEELREKVAADHHFVNAVLRGPKILLIGDEDDLAGVA